MTTLHAKDTAETSPVATQDDVAVLPDEALNDVHGGLDLGAVWDAVAAAAASVPGPRNPIDIVSPSWGVTQQ